MTFQDLCARILRDEALEAGVDPFATPVAPADRLAMLLERIDDLPLRHHDLRGNPSALLGSIVGRIDRLKGELITCEDYAAWAATLAEDADPARSKREREFAALFRAHDRLVAEAGTLDFGDLVLHTFRLLREKPHVRARLAGRFRHVLVDDLQDTSFAQGLLLRLLVADHGNVTGTGDDDQAIHRFRGAATKAFADFEAEWPQHPYGPARALLPQRASKIVRAATAVAQHAPDRIAKELTAEEGGHVAFWRCATERAQAQAVAGEVERLIARDEEAVTRPRPVAPRTSACSCAPSAARARRSPSRSRSARSRTAWPARPRSSSAPRSATCWRGCGCSSTPATPARSCARSPARPSSCGRSTSRA